MNDETIEYLTDLALETFNKESTVLPILQKQYAQTLTAINNLITAMEKVLLHLPPRSEWKNLKRKRASFQSRL